MTTILIKKKDTAGAPAAGDLTNAAGGAEIAVNTATKRLYTKDSGGTVVELGTNPSALTTNLLFSPDATYDIGASGASRPRDMFLSRNLTVGGTLVVTGGINFNGNVTVGDSSSDTLTINSTITSNLLFTDNTYDIGASGATRPRNLYLAGSLTAAGNTILGAGTSQTTTVNGVLNIASGSSYPLNASVTGGVSAYLYSDGGGSGIASNNPYTGGSLLYLTTTSHNQYIGSSQITKLTTAGLSIGLGNTGPTSTLDVAAGTPGFDSVGTAFLRSTDALGSGIGAQLTMGGRYTSSQYYAFGGIAARKENATSGNVAGSLYLMTTTTGGSLRPVMQFNSSGNAILGIWSNSPLNGGGNASWLTADAVSGSVYSGGLICAIGGVSTGAFYYDTNYMKVQAATGGGIKLIANNNSEQLTILSSGQAAINTTPRTNVALATAAGWSGPGGWYIAHSAEATSYPMIRWLATSPDKACAIGNNGDGSMLISVGGSSTAIGVTPITIAATGVTTFSQSAKFDAANAPLVVAGSGYTLNPSNMVLGQYTSTRAYIQTPGGSGGQVEIWDGSTNQVIVFNAYGMGLYGSAGTSGSGITFPSTQQNSSNANTLDDYEEGSFAGSVTVRGSGTAGTYGLSIGSANYTKIGRLVMIQMAVAITSASGGTGYLQVTGMPFTNTAQCIGSLEGNYMTLNGSTAQIVPEFISASGQTIIYFREMFTSGSGQDFPISNISSSTSFTLTMTYITST